MLGKAWHATTGQARGGGGARATITRRLAVHHDDRPGRARITIGGPRDHAITHAITRPTHQRGVFLPLHTDSRNIIRKQSAIVCNGYRIPAGGDFRAIAAPVASTRRAVRESGPCSHVIETAMGLVGPFFKDRSMQPRLLEPKEAHGPRSDDGGGKRWRKTTNAMTPPSCSSCC